MLFGYQAADDVTTPLADALDVVRANRAGEQAVVADAVEAARQHVQEKAADELAGVERHGLEPVAAFDAVILPLEGPALLVERWYNSDMDVAADLEHLRSLDAISRAYRASKSTAQPLVEIPTSIVRDMLNSR